MSSKFFDFNLPNGSELPEDIILVQAFNSSELSKAEVINNRLEITGSASSYIYGSLVGYDTGSRHGVVKGTVTLLGGNYIGLFFRSGRVSSCLSAVYDDTGHFYVVDRQPSEETLIESGYQIPNFDANAPYDIEVHMRGEDIDVFLDGNPIYSFKQTVGFTSTIHGFRGQTGGVVDNLTVADGEMLPLIGNKPVLSVSGNPETNVFIGDEVPEFTATAFDEEDGDLTGQIIITGNAADNTNSGSYTQHFEVQDSDFQIARATRTVNIISKPILEYRGRDSYTIVQGQPWKPPLAYFIEESGIRGSIEPQNWTETHRNTIGGYTLLYQHTDAEGVSSDEIQVTVNVIPRPTITDTGPFSMVQEYGEEYITVDGYELKRFDSPDGESWSYGFENDVTIHAVDILKTSNETTNNVIVARIPIPFDSLARCTSTTVSIDLQMDNFVDGSKLEISFGQNRAASKYRILKNIQSQRTVMEFEIKPFHDSSFRVYGLGNGKDPDKFFVDYNTHDWHLSTDTEIVVYFKFGDTTPAANILALNATARVGKARFFADGEHFLNGKDSFDITPFRPDDPMNKKLPPNIVTRTKAVTDHKTDINAEHYRVTAGSAWVQVADVSEVQIGDIPAMAITSHASVGGETLFSVRTNAANSELTKQVLGYAQYVEEIDYANNRFRMTRPALLDHSTATEGLDWMQRYTCIFTAPPEIITLVHGEQGESWRTSPLNGTDKRDVNNVSYGNKTVVYELDNHDPLTKFKFDFILPQNNFTAPFEGEDLESTTFGERLENGEFELPLPAGFDGNDSTFLNADKNYYFVLPNKTYGLHTYLTRPVNEDGFVTCSRITGHDLSQWSASQILHREDSPSGRTNSPRASGLSAASMIRQEDMDKITCRGFTEADIDADLDVAENAIQHAIPGYLSSGQFQSPSYMVNVDDPESEANYFIHLSYNRPLTLVNGGSGYARGDTIELCCPNRADTHMPTIYAVEAVGVNGEIQAAFCTRTGQHISDPSSATHQQFKTSGSGTGAVFDTTSMFTQSHYSLQCGAYPTAMADSHFDTIYKGAIPNGGIMTIDPSFDLRGEWKAAILKAIQETGTIPNSLSYEFYAVCSAIKKYGWNPCDAASNTFAPLIVDSRMVDTSAFKRLFNRIEGKFTYPNAAELRKLLVPVHNFTPAHHLETDQDLAPVLEIIAGEDIVVPPNWRDPKCFALSPLYGDLSAQVTVDKEFDFTTLEPQEFYYSVTDKDGRTSTIGPRRVVVDIPQPIAEAGPNLTLKAGEPFKLQGYGAPSIETIEVDYIEWTQLEGDATSLSDRFIGDPTGIAPSAIDAQTLVYQLKVVDTNGLEATDTMSIEVAALEGRSAVRIEIPDAPDGTTAWAIVTDSGNRTVFRDYVTFNNGFAIANQLPVDAGELVRGTVDVGNTLESEGTGFKGITYAI